MLIVTTTTRPDVRLGARARAVASRCGVAAVPRRRSLAAHLAEAGASLAYVVGRERDALADEETRLSVGAGLLHAHLAAGMSHPLIAALGPLPAGAHVVDATLGLGQDALHVAAVTGATVTGIEISAALYSLIEEGLPRLASQGIAAARRIEPVHGDARQILPTLRGHAVMLSPMFDAPRRAPPGFTLLRRVAEDAPLDRAWLDAALQCAPRVVVKARPGQPVPPAAQPHLRQVLRGRAVAYWVLGRGSAPGSGPT